MGAEGAYRPGKLAFYDNLSLTLFLQVTGNTFVLGKKKKKGKKQTTSGSGLFIVLPLSALLTQGSSLP